MTPYKEAVRLVGDIERLRAHEGKTLGSFMSRDVLRKLAVNKRKDKFRLAYTEALGGFDERIRFVEGNRDGRPKATIKLFGASQLSEVKKGLRMAALLGGGVVVVATHKQGEVQEWRLTGIQDLIPRGGDLRLCEEALESLYQAFSLRNPDEPFPALSEHPFQIRTGSSSGGYAVYLLASRVFRDSRG